MPPLPSPTKTSCLSESLSNASVTQRPSEEEAGGSDASDLDDRMGNEIKDLDESDPCAVARYLDSLDPGVRFFISDEAQALEARTLDDPDWNNAHAQELMNAARTGDLGANASDGVLRYRRPDDPNASDRLAASVDDPCFVDDVCGERAVSDRLLRSRTKWADTEDILENPYLTETQRSALSADTPDSGFTHVSDRETPRAMLFRPEEGYRARAVARNRDMVWAGPGAGGAGAHRPVRPGARVSGLGRHITGHTEHSEHGDGREQDEQDRQTDERARQAGARPLRAALRPERRHRHARDGQERGQHAPRP